MALDYDTILSALNTMLEDDITSQINRAVVLSQLIPVKRSAGQKQVAWDVRVGTSTGAAVSDGATVSSYNLDTKVPATLSFCTYNDTFQVFGRAMSAAAQAGPDALKNLFEEEVQNSVERLAAAINVDLYTGSGGSSPETIAGLTSVALVGSASSYASVSGSTYSQWNSYVNANGGTPRDLSLQLMRDTRKQIYINSGQKIDLVIMDPNQFERYANIMTGFRRMNQDVTVAGRKISLDGGFESLEFDGVPVIQDKDAPAGKVLFLNTRFMNLWHLPDAAESLVGGTQGEKGIMGSPEEQLGDGAPKLVARIQPLAVNGDVRNFQTLVYTQLQVKRPNAMGVLADLTTP